MVFNIRLGIFETNSSSMHSLSLGNPALRKVDASNRETITLGIGEYGWGPEELTEWLEKADYLAVDGSNSDRVLLESVIKSKFPNIAINFKIDGYLDHESVQVIWREINDSVNREEFLYDVLFGKASIFIDNDNREPDYSDWDNNEYGD